MVRAVEYVGYFYALLRALGQEMAVDRMHILVVIQAFGNSPLVGD